MQAKMASGELQTTWFERHNAIPRPGPHPEWPQDYQDLVRRRMEVIAADRNIALIEQPEYKRRWNTEPWEDQLDARAPELASRPPRIVLRLRRPHERRAR